jgi:hypothetical protein
VKVGKSVTETFEMLKIACGEEAMCLPEDEYNMFQTYRRQEDLNKKINSKSALCRLTLHNPLSGN